VALKGWKVTNEFCMVQSRIIYSGSELSTIDPTSNPDTKLQLRQVKTGWVRFYVIISTVVFRIKIKKDQQIRFPILIRIKAGKNGPHNRKKFKNFTPVFELLSVGLEVSLEPERSLYWGLKRNLRH
jgi:hypothetical protein